MDSFKETINLIFREILEKFDEIIACFTRYFGNRFVYMLMRICKEIISIIYFLLNLFNSFTWFCFFLKTINVNLRFSIGLSYISIYLFKHFSSCSGDSTSLSYSLKETSFLTGISSIKKFYSSY